MGETDDPAMTNAGTGMEEHQEEETSPADVPDRGLWKIGALIGLFVAFLVFVAFFVYPSQMGTLSSTELQIGALRNASPDYAETLPLQEVDINNQGRSMFIAFVMLTHILFANLMLGGSWIAVVSESFFLRAGLKRLDRIARSLTLFNVILFSFGATFAMAGVLFFIALFPTFVSNWFHVMWWPLFVEAILFALEIVFLYTYWFSWNKIRDSYHQVLGYAFAIAVFFQTLLINMVAGGMLTPGVTEITFGGAGILTVPFADALAMWFNPLLWRLQYHRIFGAISYVGFLLAMLAVFHFLDRKSVRDKKYWDWVVGYGISWGLFGLIIQPFIGLTLMLLISDVNETAFNFMMHGPRAWEMLLMIGTFTFLFLAVTLFFLERREKLFSAMENRNIHTLFKAFFAIALLSGFILIQPAWLYAPFVDDPAAWANPLGSMDFKYWGLGALILMGAVMLTIDFIILSEQKESEWGALSRTSRLSAIFAGFLGIFILEIMGFVRESGRSPWTVYDIIPVPPASTAYPTPLAIGNIFGVWAIISVIVIIVLWLTSKATAHHPEEAEEI